MSFEDLTVDRRSPAFYEATGGDGAAPTVVFRFVPEGGPAAEQSDPVVSGASDPEVEWDDMEGVQAVAQSILVHYTGSEPGQAALEALVMAKGDEWAAGEAWTLSVDDLDAIIG